VPFKRVNVISSYRNVSQQQPV